MKLCGWFKRGRYQVNTVTVHKGFQKGGINYSGGTMAKSITDGVLEIIDEGLNLFHIGKAPHFKHKKSCLILNNTPATFDADKVISKIYEQLVSNLKYSDNRFHSQGPSDKNWRFEKIPYIAKHNGSKEKILEKSIAKLPAPDWVNQVPTSSGLIGSSSDKLRNIDLVHSLGKREYEFIELKVNSDTPMFAAFEIVINGMIYLLSREFYPNQCIDSKEILNARKVHLQTLAPQDYYSEYSLDWLENELNKGLKTFLSEKFNGKFEMDFSFTSFPESFNCSCKDNELLKALDNRVAVKWNN